MFCTVNKYARVAFRFGLPVQGRGVGMTHGQCDAGLLKTTLVRFVVDLLYKSTTNRTIGVLRFPSSLRWYSLRLPTDG